MTEDRHEHRHGHESGLRIIEAPLCEGCGKPTLGRRGARPMCVECDMGVEEIEQARAWKEEEDAERLRCAASEPSRSWPTLKHLAHGLEIAAVLALLVSVLFDIGMELGKATIEWIRAGCF